MASHNRYDVIIIGAGIIGSNTALHLAQSGIEDILVLEKDSPASKASGRSAGNISTTINHRYGSAISEYCNQFFQEFSSKYDDVEIYRQSVYFLAHSEEEVEDLKRTQEERPIESQLLSDEEFLEKEPSFNPENHEAALEFPCGKPHTDPYTVTVRVLEEARELGTTLKTEAVIDLEQIGDGIRVLSDNQEYEAPIVVNAAGAWSKSLAEKIGVKIPLKPRPSQIAVLRPEGECSFPQFKSHEYGFYGREEPNGDVLIGRGSTTRVNPDDFSTKAREKFIQETADYASMLSNHLDNARLVNDWAGRTSNTPDGRPLIGETPVPGFYISAGFNGGGFKFSPFAARVLTDDILNESPKFDIEPFDPDRFSGDEEF